jgi:signal transduction histidine kinase
MNRSKLHFQRNIKESETEKIVIASPCINQESQRLLKRNGRSSFEKDLLITVLKIWEVLFYRGVRQNLFEHVLLSANSLFGARSSFMFLTFTGCCHRIGPDDSHLSNESGLLGIRQIILERMQENGQVVKILTNSLPEIAGSSETMVLSAPYIFCCHLIFQDEDLGILCLEHDDPDMMEHEIAVTALQFFTEQAAFLIHQNRQMDILNQRITNLSEWRERFLSSGGRSDVEPLQSFQPIETINSYDLNQIILDFMAGRAAEFSQRNVVIDHQLQVDLPDIFIDSEQIQCMLLTLVETAICNRDHVKIIIKTSHCQDTGRIRLSVCDDGPGIPKYRLKQIFNAFNHASETGQNDKLNLCDTIIQKYGGTLAMKSIKGGGTQFIVAFPAHQEYEAPN